MKKLILFLTAIFMSFAVRAEDPAIGFVDKLADKILAEIVATDKTKDAKEAFFRDAFVEGLDLKGIGQFVLGTAWKKTSEDDRTAFLNAFTDLTVKTWADRFNLYTGQQIVFQGTRNAERGQIYVDSVIQDKQPVEVIWRLRPSKDSYKIVDIIVEGVSMAATYRNDYRAFLQQNANSVPALTAELERKSREFKPENSK